MMTRIVQSTRAGLFTTIYPKDGSETVLLLHGGPGVPMDFSPVIDLLASKYQVIAFDQRGTGRSPAPGARYSIEEYIDDIEAISRFCDLDMFHVFGHSWGGLYAQIYAERRPEKVLSLFLCSPSSGTGSQWKQTEREVLSFNRKCSGFAGFLQMGLGSLLGGLGSDKAYRSVFKKVLANYHKEFDPTFRATEAMVENVRAKPINKTRPRILKYPLLKDAADDRFPILVAYGERDIYGPSRQFVRDRFPRAVIIEIEGAGHLAWKQNKKRFDAVLRDFYHLP